MSDNQKLFAALLAYQQDTGGLEADKRGNRSSYASIGEVINSAKLSGKFGLTFSQPVNFVLDGGNLTIFVHTILAHVSGEYIESRYPVIVDDFTNNQKVGGAITYAKRYALASILGTEKGVEEADDDGAENGEFDDPAKETTPVTSDTDSLPSVDTGHSPAGGVKPVGRAFINAELLANCPADKLNELVGHCDDLKVLEAGFKNRGGPSMPKEEMREFATRKKELVNG
jgi:hypothetical protein